MATRLGGLKNASLLSTVSVGQESGCNFAEYPWLRILHEATVSTDLLSLPGLTRRGSACKLAGSCFSRES